MKAELKYTFDLPEEQSEMTIITRHWEYYSKLHDVREMIRRKVKYEDVPEHLVDFFDELLEASYVED